MGEGGGVRCGWRVVGVDECVGWWAWWRGVVVGGGDLTVVGGCVIVGLAIRVKQVSGGAWEAESILSGGVFDDASVVGEGDDVSVADDVVGGDEGGAVSVGDQLSLIGSDRAGLLDVLDLHVAVSDGGSRRRRPDVSFPRGS